MLEMYANLHTHTTHSDGVFSPEEIVKLAKSAGYKAIAATDHDTETDWPHYFKTCFSASLAHSIGQKFRYPIMQILDLIALNHDSGGIAVVAHPAESVQILTIPELVGFGLDGIEVWHNSVVRGGYQRKTLEYTLEYGLYVSGGKDHSGLCGGQYLYFEDYKNNPYYAENLSLGTRHEYYEEIRDRKHNPNREEIIKKYTEMYPPSILPSF